jgi:hypothetical protein
MLNDINEQFTDLAREISKAAQGWAQLDEEVRGDLVQFAQPFRDVTDEVRAIGLEVRRAWESALDDWSRSFQERLASVVANLERSLERFPQRNQDALRTLAQNGWYLDPDFPIASLFECEELFAAGKAEHAHVELSSWFESRSVEVETALCSQSSARARLLHKAFEAHRRGEFALAIPVFLAQADGMCREITGAQLFSRRDGIGIASWVGRLELRDALPRAEALLSALLLPLVEKMPISASEAERSALSDALNRHAVLHGEDLDYDTHLNSCRAISLLVYVSWILREATTPPDT